MHEYVSNLLFFLGSGLNIFKSIHSSCLLIHKTYSEEKEIWPFFLRFSFNPLHSVEIASIWC